MPSRDARPQATRQLDRSGRGGPGGSDSSGGEREDAASPLETLTLTEEYRASWEGACFWTGRWSLFTANGTLWAEHLHWRDALRQVEAFAEWFEAAREVMHLGDPRYGGPAPTV